MTTPNAEHCMMIGNDNINLKNVAILDNGSTFSVFSNPNLVAEIQAVPETMEMLTNVGSRINNTKAKVTGY